MKCWDLEYNKVIRHYHGHLSAIQDLTIHPTIDVLITCARDATARVYIYPYLSILFLFIWVVCRISGLKLMSF